MTVGSIVSLNRNETDQTKITFAVQQLLQRNSGQQVNASVSVTTAYSIKASDYAVNVSGNTEVTLPSASSVPGQSFCVKKLDSSGTTVTISPGSTADLIDGSTSKTLTVQYDSIEVQSDATKYNVNRPATGSTTGYLLAANALSELSTLATTARSNLGLGTAAVLNVGTSASNVVQLSTSAKLPAVDGSALTNLPAQTGRLSAGTSLVLNPYGTSTTVTQAHGLGGQPAIINSYLECLTAEGGFSVGDRAYSYATNAPTIGSDATNTFLSISSGTPGVWNKSSHSIFSITLANWKVVVVPYSIT